MNVLETTRLLLVVLHLAGVATVLITWVLQLQPGRQPRLRPLVAGAVVAAATGAALVIVRQLADLPVDVIKITVKLLITALLLTAASLAATQRRSSSGRTPAGSRRYVQAAGLLAISNVVIALAWN